MQEMWIMQGASGSGKTTLAGIIEQYVMRTTKQDILVLSTDDFWYQNDGSYKFDCTKIAAAHRWNQERAATWLARGRSVIIDNTNVRAWEARPYVRLGVKHGCRIHFVRCMGEHANVHGVPLEKVAEMRRNLETLSVEICLAAMAPWEEPKDNFVI